MKFWEVNNISSSEGELLLYGEIRSDKPWWNEGQMITPEEFLNDIAPLENKSKVTIRLNSRGGDVFAAQAIYTQLKTMKATKEIIIDGIAASAATIIAMAGDSVKIPKGAAFMIHNPSITVWDSFMAKDLEQLKNMLDSVKNCIIETYCTKTTLSKEELSEMMDREEWLTGTQAVEKGFCDELLEVEDPVNKVLNSRMLMINNVVHDFSGFKNMPVFETVAKIPQPIENTPKTKPNEVENKKEEGKIMNLEELKEKYPNLVNQIRNEAKEEGEKGERERIKNIEKIATNISDELVAKAKFEEPMNAEKLAFMALQDDANKGKNFLKNLTQDTENSNVHDVTATGDNAPSNKEEESKDKVSRITKLLNSDKRRVR
ncbi:MAG: head maturation protease, ClpP-related [Cellulosilyticaceae bacterium]